MSNSNTHIMEMHNVEMPLFAPASGMTAAHSWNEVDHLDFDLVAEYLLNDGNPFSMMTTGSNTAAAHTPLDYM
jgi:hypothetical protein